MSLLKKTNPKATRRSVIRWAAVGAVVGCVLCAMLLRNNSVPGWAWCVALPVASLFMAACFALAEWQLGEC